DPIHGVLLHHERVLVGTEHFALGGQRGVLITQLRVLAGERRHLLDERDNLLLLLIHERLERRHGGVKATRLRLVARGKRRNATTALRHPVLGELHARREFLHTRQQLRTRFRRAERFHLAVAGLHGLIRLHLFHLTVHF